MNELPMIIGPCPECGSSITHRQVYISKQENGYPKEATLRCDCGWMNSIDISGPVVPSLQSALNPIGRESLIKERGASMNVNQLSPEQVDALEEASDKVRRGEPISMDLALLVIQYQKAKQSRPADPPDRPSGCLVGPAILLAAGLWLLL